MADTMPSMLSARSEIQQVSRDFAKYIIDVQDYEKIRIIGKGGYAEVWLVKKKGSEEQLALKQLFSDVTPKQIHQFAREIRTMADMDHPFFLKFLGFSQKSPLSILSEYIPNGSLYKYIKSSNELTGTQKTLIAMGISNAMAVLHSHGIIHRDLKSLNILLHTDFMPRICDFGIARFYSGDQMTMRLGTPFYMPPESLHSSNGYGFPVDVYSFAMLLYEMLTYKIPWADMDPFSVIKMVVLDGARPELPPDGSESIKALISACWAQNPDERPTFVSVYKAFESGEVSFDGTERQSIVNLASKLNKYHLAEPSKEDLEEKLRKSDSMGKLSLTIESPHQRAKSLLNFAPSALPVDVLSNTSNTKFRAALSDVSRNLLHQDAKQFFSIVASLFNSKTSDRDLAFILNAIRPALIYPYAIRALVKFRLHLVIPLEKPDLIDPSLEILLILFAKTPQIFGSDFKSRMITIINSRPDKALILLALYSKQFSTLEDPWPLLDLLIIDSEALINSDDGFRLFSIFHFLCSTFSDYRDARLSDALKVAASSLYSNNTSVLRTAYCFLCHFYSNTMRINYKFLSQHMNDPSLSEPILRIILKDRRPPASPNLISSLFTLSKNSKEANLCLLIIASDESGASMILDEKGWIDSRTPTYYDTFRLVLSLYGYKALRQRISDIYDLYCLFANLIKEGNPKVVDSISVLVRRLPQNHSVLSYFTQSGALKEIYELAIRRKDEPSLRCSLLVTQVLTSYGEAPEYQMLIPMLKQLLKVGNSLSSAALTVIVSLSQFPLCSLHFKKLKLEKYFEGLLNDPDYRNDAAAFLKNLKVAQYYDG